MRALVCALLCAATWGQGAGSAVARAPGYLTSLLRIDTTNPPGNETRVAEYLRGVAAPNGIACELLGPNPARLSFVARLTARSPIERPLLLMAHSDVVPADRAQWSVAPFSAVWKDGFLYGRGAQDDKSLLAAELAVLVELKRRNAELRRDVILLSEADEEAGSTGITWLIAHAWPKIDAEFALNEGGAALEVRSGVRVFQVQTSEKAPARVVLTAHGAAGHGSLPRSDNAVVHLARAVVRLAEADQPVRLSATTRRYLGEISRLPDYEWLRPLLGRLDDPNTATSAANQIRDRDPELNAMLRTSLSPTMLQAGAKINVIPNTATAQIDVRRLPSETREEVEMRIRRIINDPAVEIAPEPGLEMPAAETSSPATVLYKSMEQVFRQSAPHVLVVPYMSRGASDGAFLRHRGVPVYGAPLFLREGGESRAHGNDERISPENLANGTELLWKIVWAVCVKDGARAQ